MNDERSKPHRGPDHSAPYPVSRLAPAFQAEDLARELAQAEAMLSARTTAKLQVIVEQIHSLQAQAREVLREAQQEQALTRARCTFKRIPGQTYHLYRKGDGSSYFSMLSPADWRGWPPDEPIGSYRLEADWSWTPAGQERSREETGDRVRELLRIGVLADRSGQP